MMGKSNAIFVANHDFPKDVVHPFEVFTHAIKHLENGLSSEKIGLVEGYIKHEFGIHFHFRIQAKRFGIKPIYLCVMFERKIGIAAGKTP